MNLRLSVDALELNDPRSQVLSMPESIFIEERINASAYSGRLNVVFNL